MPNLSDLAGYGRDFLQGASNAAASNISAPVDGLAWLLNKGGMNIQNPVGGSDWMAQQGLTQQPQSRLAGMLGEAAGGVTPMLAAAKAPQIAGAVTKIGENAIAPQTLSKQAGVINWPNSPKSVYHGSAEPFEKFDPSMLGTNTKAADAGVGFHFSDNKADAGFYADMAKRAKLIKDEPWLSQYDVDGARGAVMQFNLDIKKPLVVGMNESEGNAGKLTQQFLDDKWAARRHADANGFDGLIYPHGTNVDSAYTAIAFDPSQITKSAIQTKKK